MHISDLKQDIYSKLQDRPFSFATDESFGIYGGAYLAISVKVFKNKIIEHNFMGIVTDEVMKELICLDQKKMLGLDSSKTILTS